MGTLRTLLASLLLAASAWGHGSPVYLPTGPLHVEQGRIFDAKRRQFTLSGVQIPGLEVFAPTARSQAQVGALNARIFRVLQQRWNMNSVRLLLSPWIWRRDGRAYLDLVGRLVKLANDEGLVVILTAHDSAVAGSLNTTGLPIADIGEFWTACATYFKDAPLVAFGLYARPSIQFVPGAVEGTRRASDWVFWKNGGIASDGRTVLGMDALASRIRATGAAQLIAASAYHDTPDFRGFGPEHFLSDPNTIYEVHPTFDHAATDAERTLNFGALSGSVPVYAGEWGVDFADSASCRATPGDVQGVREAVAQLLTYMTNRTVSWSVVSFEPGSLISELDEYTPTELSTRPACGQATQAGIGTDVLLTITGDALGFGSLAADQIANAASNQVGPVAPGEVLSIYAQAIGPDVDQAGRLDDSGKLAADLGETRVTFDGIPAPLYFSGYFQVNAQVPYEVAGRETTAVQVTYRGVPSNRVVLLVRDSAPSLFALFGYTDALAVNEDSSRNTSATPAAAGSIVVLYATGAGALTPGGVTGRPASVPLGRPVLPVSLIIDGRAAEILYAGEAPGFVGVLQINARVPASASGAVPIVLTVGTRRAPSLRIWVK